MSATRTGEIIHTYIHTYFVCNYVYYMYVSRVWLVLYLLRCTKSLWTGMLAVMKLWSGWHWMCNSFAAIWKRERLFHVQEKMKNDRNIYKHTELLLLQTTNAYQDSPKLKMHSLSSSKSSRNVNSFERIFLLWQVTLMWELLVWKQI